MTLTFHLHVAALSLMGLNLSVTSAPLLTFGGKYVVCFMTSIYPAFFMTIYLSI